jgi:hypothetical protein
VLLPKFEPTNPETIQWLSVSPYSFARAAGGTAAGDGSAALWAVVKRGSAASAAAIR